jgi:hypothetical protein
MVKAKEDIGDTIVFLSKGKISHVKPQVKPMTKAKVVAWPLHKINLFN